MGVLLGWEGTWVGIGGTFFFLLFFAFLAFRLMGFFFLFPFLSSIIPFGILPSIVIPSFTFTSTFTRYEYLYEIRERLMIMINYSYSIPPSPSFLASNHSSRFVSRPHCPVLVLVIHGFRQAAFLGPPPSLASSSLTFLKISTWVY